MKWTSFRRVSYVAVACTVAALAASHDPWLRIQSPNFELFTTAGERDGRGLLLHFEQVRGFFQEAFGREFASRKPVRLIAFRNEKEFAPYRPNEAAAAFYHPGRDHDFIVMSHISAEESQVATHEYTHLLINQAGVEMPVWLNEGLADLYSTLEQAGTRTVLGAPPPAARGRSSRSVGSRSAPCWPPRAIPRSTTKNRVPASSTPNAGR